MVFPSGLPKRRRRRKRSRPYKHNSNNQRSDRYDPNPHGGATSIASSMKPATPDLPGSSWMRCGFHKEQMQKFHARSKPNRNPKGLQYNRNTNNIFWNYATFPGVRHSITPDSEDAIFPGRGFGDNPKTSSASQISGSPESCRNEQSSQNMGHWAADRMNRGQNRNSMKSDNGRNRFVGNTSGDRTTNELTTSDNCTQNRKRKYCILATATNAKRRRYDDYKFLEKLSRMQSHDLLFTIKDPKSRFIHILNGDKIVSNFEWLMLLFQIIKIICTEFDRIRYEVLLQICESKVIKQLKRPLTSIWTEDDKRILEKLPSFIENLVVFFNAVIDVIPTVAEENEFKMLLRVTEKLIKDLHFERSIIIDDCLTKKLKVLEDKIKENKMKREKPAVAEQRLYPHQILEKHPPPEDFRKLSLYPTEEDLMRNGFGYLRQNKTHGAYDNVEHYLDVQYRLLREDFIDPFRCGIKEYLKAKESQCRGMKYKYDQIRFYTVKFESVEVLRKNNTIAFGVNFDADQKMRNINWEYSKRFMFGSLLLFTGNDFETFFCGTVADRDVRRLRNGRVLVTFREKYEFRKDLFRSSFLMAESSVYFEPYFLVMKSLKHFTEDNFPMKRFIVEGRTIAGPPQYLQRFTQQYKIEQHTVNIRDPGTWPSSYALQLDEYQYSAFRAALTREFAIIQGPPGTGKTFLGLKIVKTLLENVRLNPKATKLPILVVCYTNHALDQFLEGILKFTTCIVRIGSQSKSELLQSFNLRSSHMRYSRNPRNVARVMLSHKQKIKSILEDINVLNAKKKIIEHPDGIFKLELIADFMWSAHREKITNNNELIDWLLEESPDDQEVEADISETPLFQEEYAVEDYASGEEFEDGDELGAAMEEDALVEDADLLDSEEVSKTCYSICTKMLIESSEKLLAEFDSAESIGDCTARIINLKNNIKQVTKILKFRGKCKPKECELNNKNPFDIPVRSRWTLYWHWVEKLLNKIMEDILKSRTKYGKMIEAYEELKQLEDLYIVQQCEIVGMTTTCAARVQGMLRQLAPSIVIVEEAAEVLESHIVTALTQKTEHLILIGDHQQLRPSSAVYKLSTRYQMDVSFFERMVKNNMDCPKLNVQHRMRPEIASLITPMIYPGLENHNSVYQYGQVQGIRKNLFFVKHTELEQEVKDSTSRQNKHEADFLLELCRYLLLQGYDPSKITILTTYIGQMFYLREQRKRYYRHVLEKVKIIVVDNYQGEENDIILLSLVRSNADAKIGFLKTENRVCVALSRAKKGLYIIGNIDNLTKSSSLWQMINKNLQQQGYIGESLMLHCETHSVCTTVSKREDFIKVKEGGCRNFCEMLLKCGEHRCKKLCHPLNREHKENNCREPCRKFCTSGHPCGKLCYEKCGNCVVPVVRKLPCDHEVELPCYKDKNMYKCMVTMETVLPLCMHKAQKRCHEDIQNVKCPESCTVRLECGHACTNTCHKNDDPDHSEYRCMKRCIGNKNCPRKHKCNKLCFQDCEKCNGIALVTLRCGHEKHVSCLADKDKIKCYLNCNRKCPSCKQPCKKLCYENCQPCENMVEKIIPYCLHKVRMKCKDPPTRDFCKEKCERTAPCGHKCRGQCFIPCVDETCQELVPIRGRNAPCGHNLMVPCFEKDRVKFLKEIPNEFLKYCKNPCGTLLKCEHVCGGTCGECYQGRLHVSCKERCGSYLICGHSCESPCREICPPCTKPCEFKCKHSQCPKKCGVPCVICQEPCEWQCKHLRCTKKCGEICDRKPCEENCDKLLKCGHPCIGFCGEPCPNKCRICDKDEVTAIKFGFEDEPDARFVCMEDCGHIIESKALDQILLEGEEIVLKGCPFPLGMMTAPFPCATAISKTLRYMNYVKTIYQHIINIKAKSYGLKDELTIILEKLKTEVEQINRKHNGNQFSTAGWPEVEDILKSYQMRLQTKVNRPLPIAMNQATVMQYFIHLFMSIGGRIDKILKLEPSLILEKAKDIIRLILMATDPNAEKINSQQVDDLACEMKRFDKMIDFCEALSRNLYKQNKTDKEIIKLRNYIEEKFCSLEPYTEAKDAEISELFKDFQEQLKSDRPLSQEEKRMIHSAMKPSFSAGGRGHWYTCSNDHYYCITECGGAMQKAKCPYCKEDIGGTDHRVASTSRRATDIDGAGYSAL